MISSPKKKKAKLTSQPANDMKRLNEDDNSSRKRPKREISNLNVEEAQQLDKLAQRKKNFITSCDQVSYNSYSDLNSRFLLLNVPPCMADGSGKHIDHKNEPQVSATPGFIEGSFNTDMNMNVWYEALEVCQISLTSKQYLSSHMLKNIVEIMMNTHTDEYTDYSTSEIINKCQEILSCNFLMHPSCQDFSLRNCYRNFLTEPMNLREKSFTNRAEFQCDEGILKYCMNRLEYELSSESTDGPLLDKWENTPENMKQNISWQKEKFEIYEMLSRNERIDRLMMVLESIIELLQLDLAIWHAKHSTNQNTSILSNNRPLIAYTLWRENNIIHTGAVNKNCRQVLRSFVQIVSLGYPQKYIHIMKTWFNTIVQTIYMCGNNSDMDYPNIQHPSLSFAEKFHDLIKHLPRESLYSILQAVHPSFMRYLIGMVHLKPMILKYAKEEDDILKVFNNILEHKIWMKFPDTNEILNTEILNNNLRREKRIKGLLRYLSKKCSPDVIGPVEDKPYPKMKEEEYFSNDKVNLVHLISILYITVLAYIDAFNIKRVYETWGSLNSKVLGHTETVATSNHDNRYTVSEEFLKKYRAMHQILGSIKSVYDKNVKDSKFPDKLKIFENINFLDLNR